MKPEATSKTQSASGHTIKAGPVTTPSKTGKPASASLPRTTRSERALLAQIIRSYETPLVRTYCRLRFLILRQRFLDEVGQYLPKQGRILDVGCGFGLFGLYFAGLFPQRQLMGYDLNSKRIAIARLAKQETGISNVQFEHGDALSLSLEADYDAAYVLDLVHHLPRSSVPSFLQGLYRCLRSPGVLVIKDVDRKPNYKRWFTLALDRMMVGFRAPIYYWPTDDLQDLLRNIGFRVYTLTMPDILPYPHLLYICHKDGGT